ncbi:PREDICTED: regulator of nonsense transcripts 3A [Condylura cristata]|uniref:regulator of nonsense transcripts 3A n=1 Tax=Condylura cristata TaxID=143302 RepID=UPI000642C99F|nr:PREDICTED: regulator of nonsense transcripts 3A [Condylura cristata]
MAPARPLACVCVCVCVRACVCARPAARGKGEAVFSLWTLPVGVGQRRPPLGVDGSAAQGRGKPTSLGLWASGAGGHPLGLSTASGPRPRRGVLPQVVIRRLPPGLTKEQLEEQLCPLPAHDYFEFFTADFSLYPHLYSRAYINFRNPDDILLFRDRFDGCIFIDSKGLEYPAVVEFAPFQKIARRKLRKTDTRTGSIEDDPEYKKFLETYCVEEEKTSASPETLLGDIEAKTRGLTGLLAPFSFLPCWDAQWGSSPRDKKPLTWPLREAWWEGLGFWRRVAPGLGVWAGDPAGAGPGPGPGPCLRLAAAPLLCGNGCQGPWPLTGLPPQRIREEKREERRRRDLEKKRVREEARRKRREQERGKRREAGRQREAAEKDVRVQLLRKPERGEEAPAEKPKGRGEDADAGEAQRAPSAGCAPPRPQGPEDASVAAVRAVPPVASFCRSRERPFLEAPQAAGGLGRWTSCCPGSLSPAPSAAAVPEALTSVSPAARHVASGERAPRLWGTLLEAASTDSPARSGRSVWAIPGKAAGAAPCSGSQAAATLPRGLRPSPRRTALAET